MIHAQNYEPGDNMSIQMNQVYSKVFRSQIMPIRDSLKGVHQKESTQYLHIKYDPGVHMSIPNNQIGPIHYTYWKGVQGLFTLAITIPK